MYRPWNFTTFGHKKLRNQSLTNFTATILKLKAAKYLITILFLVIDQLDMTDQGFIQAL